MNEHGFVITDSDGNVLVTISFHKCGSNAAHQEALKVAALVAEEGWMLLRKEDHSEKLLAEGGEL